MILTQFVYPITYRDETDTPASQHRTFIINILNRKKAASKMIYCCNANCCLCQKRGLTHLTVSDTILKKETKI